MLKHTVWSVVEELVDGLEAGNVTVSGESAEFSPSIGESERAESCQLPLGKLIMSIPGVIRGSPGAPVVGEYGSTSIAHSRYPESVWRISAETVRDALKSERLVGAAALSVPVSMQEFQAADPWQIAVVRAGFRQEQLKFSRVCIYVIIEGSIRLRAWRGSTHQDYVAKPKDMVVVKADVLHLVEWDTPDGWALVFKSPSDEVSADGERSKGALQNGP
jgi:hypothetical protein